MADDDDEYYTDEEELQAILSEQGRELLLAKTLDSDLDMAFNLQMQEALTASMAHQPYSSSTRQHSPPPPPYKRKDEIVDVVTGLMLENVERYPRELSDHEQSVSEMKKLKVEIDCRMHDQKFAGDLQNLPEQYWRKEGAYYARPYLVLLFSRINLYILQSANSYREPGNIRLYHGDGSSSSKGGPALVRESVKLYCNGVVSEEVVKGVKVVVGGIGVAICDLRDNLMFEVKKKLVAPVDDGEVVRNEVAELEALVEGFKSKFSHEI